MATTSTPYDSAAALFGANIETWINKQDAMRLAAYKLYEDIYWSRPETFELTSRGTNDQPVYLPSGRIICNTMNRYVGRNPSWVSDPELPEDKELTLWFKRLFKRIRFRSMFNTNKLYGLIRGDAAWFISANPAKPEGQRVDLASIDPGSVFWIEDEDDPDKHLGVDIVEQTVSPKDETVLYVRRQRWLKSIHPDHPAYAEDALGNAISVDGDITYQLDSYELEGWENPTEQKRFSGGETIPMELVPGITHLPVYTQVNFEEPDNTWGASELRGIEAMLAALNNTASDQDLAVAMAGLGMWVTDAPPPEDEEGNELPWTVGPSEVAEIPTGKKFDRIKGIDTIKPSIDHMEFLQDQIYRVSGTSDVAQGRVDVKEAESGIALRLRMGPILDEADTKDQLIADCLDQLFYDLRQWFDVYENTDFYGGDALEASEKATILCKFGDKLPEDKDATFDRLLKGYNAIPPLWPASYVRDECRRLGFPMPTEVEIIKAQALELDAAQIEGGRLDEEAADGEQ